jgi:polyhydroxyalkanoate synthesis repressor PhaR
VRHADFDGGCKKVKTTGVVIKKYGNRRLYDTLASRYVNLDDIAALIRDGRPVQVLDARTGEDITRVVLTQIIVEDARTKPSGLPSEFLRQLIMTSDQVGREFIMWYLNSAFDAYKKVQHSLQNGLAEVQSAATSPVDLIKNFIKGKETPRPTEADTLQELQKRIAELEARLEHSPSAKKPKRRAPRS